MSAAGFSTQSFYSSTKNNTKLKRRLESACQSVKVKRVQDYLLSDTLAHSNNLHKDNKKVPLIYRAFAKQSEALEFAERFVSSKLKVFAFELDASGKRNFLACHPHTFWRLLRAKSANARHAYEVIGEDMPSKLYFDLEFKKSEFPQADGDAILSRFKSFLKSNLLARHGFLGDPRADPKDLLRIEKVELMDLDSSSADKFSHHLIVNLYDCQGVALFFANNKEVGHVVRSLLTLMKQNPDLTLDHDGSKTTFVDEAVYTKNRNFRTFMSSKFGKSAILSKTLEAQDISDQDFFFKSLVTYHDDDLDSIEQMERKKLIRFDIATLSYQRVTLPNEKSKSSKSGKPSNSASSPSASSPFPEIDKHIRSLVSPKGGYIRKVTTSNCGWYLTYEFGNFRSCAKIGRDHKSNNVKYVVDLKTNRICQTCHDVNCQDFVSEFWDLPKHCAIPWQDLFDDDDRGSLWNSFSDERTSKEEEEIDALLLQAAEEAVATDQLLLQIAEEEEDELFMTQAAQQFP